MTGPLLLRAPNTNCLRTFAAALPQVRALSALQDYPHPFLPHCVDSFSEAVPGFPLGLASGHEHERPSEGNGDDNDGDSGRSGISRTFLVMRYMAGPDLAQHLDASGGRCAPRDVPSLFALGRVQELSGT